MKTLIILSLAALLLVSSQVSADPNCEIGIYGDTAGTESFFFPPDYLTLFPVYIVMRAEALVSAVSLNVEYQGGYPFVMAFWEYGPQGNGLDIQTANGHNIGLGECVVGFGNLPVVVATIWMLQTLGPVPGDLGKGPIPDPFLVTANFDEDPNFPVYSTCQGALHTCENITTGWLYPVKTESKSWGQVKSLY